MLILTYPWSSVFQIFFHGFHNCMIVRKTVKGMTQINHLYQLVIILFTGTYPHLHFVHVSQGLIQIAL